MHGVSVGVAVHGHGADAHLLGRAHDAASDLPSVGDQHLLDPSHRCTVNKQRAKLCPLFPEIVGQKSVLEKLPIVMGTDITTDDVMSVHQTDGGIILTLLVSNAYLISKILYIPIDKDVALKLISCLDKR